MAIFWRDLGFGESSNSRGRHAPSIGVGDWSGIVLAYRRTQKPRVPSGRQGGAGPAVQVGIEPGPPAGLAVSRRRQADGLGHRAAGGGREMAQRQAERPGRGQDQSRAPRQGDQRHHQQRRTTATARRRSRPNRSACPNGRVTRENCRRSRRSLRSGSACRADRGARSGTAIILIPRRSTEPAHQRPAIWQRIAASRLTPPVPIRRR